MKEPETTSVEKPVLIPRLAVMMFLQFFVWGAWYVSMDGFLGEAGMKEANNGLSFHAAAYTVAPIAAILAPLTLGLVADRLLNTEWVLAILNLLGGRFTFLCAKLGLCRNSRNLFGAVFPPLCAVLARLHDLFHADARPNGQPFICPS